MNIKSHTEFFLLKQWYESVIVLWPSWFLCTVHNWREVTAVSNHIIWSPTKCNVFCWTEYCVIYQQCRVWTIQNLLQYVDWWKAYLYSKRRFIGHLLEQMVSRCCSCQDIRMLYLMSASVYLPNSCKHLTMNLSLDIPSHFLVLHFLFPFHH
jgi:hypothetical protein